MLQHVCNRHRLQDAARRRRDPTQCQDARARLETFSRRAVALWKADVRNGVVNADALGLGRVTMFSLHPADRVGRVIALIRGAAEHRLLGLDDVFRMTVRAVYSRGYAKAYAELRPDVAAPHVISHSYVFQTVAGTELKGIIEASLQAAARVTAETATRRKESPVQFFDRLAPVFKTIALARLTLMVNTLVTMAYNGGKLDAYEILGLAEVNVLPETLPPIKIGDARRARGFVTILTAGDDRVCDRCDALAGQTYSLAEARGLLPVHPNCRCAVVPSHDRRFAPPSVFGDFNPNHEPGGTPIGGEFASGPGGVPDNPNAGGKVTGKEKASLKEYAGPLGFEDINKALRYAPGPLPVRLQDHVDNIDAVLSRAALADDITLYRGMEGKRLANVKPGAVLKDKAFVSTSSRRDVASRFLGDAAGTLIEVKAAKGDRVLSMAAFSRRDEAEFLFPHGTRFKVVSNEVTSPGRNLVRVEPVHGR